MNRRRNIILSAVLSFLSLCAVYWESGKVGEKSANDARRRQFHSGIVLVQPLPDTCPQPLSTGRHLTPSSTLQLKHEPSEPALLVDPLRLLAQSEHCSWHGSSTFLILIHRHCSLHPTILRPSSRLDNAIRKEICEAVSRCTENAVSTVYEP